MSYSFSYKDSKGEKYYRISFCAYFDILGFSEKIKENDLEFFDNYLELIEEQINYIHQNNKFERFELKVFTDNFVIGQPWYDYDGESELGNLFDFLSRIQFQLAISNIFLKGAISLSNLYMDEHVVIGPALIEAYELETKKSIYPRIILSEDVIKTVSTHLGYYGKLDYAPQAKEYLVDIDGQYFVNYLYHTIQYIWPDINDATVKESIELLLKHKSAVENNLSTHSDNFKVFDKYRWVARYHNYFCNSFLGNLSKNILTDLTISETLYEKSISRVTKET